MQIDTHTHDKYSNELVSLTSQAAEVCEAVSVTAGWSLVRPRDTWSRSDFLKMSEDMCQRSGPVIFCLQCVIIPFITLSFQLTTMRVIAL